MFKIAPLILACSRAFRTPKHWTKKNAAKDDRKHLATREIEKLIAAPTEPVTVTCPADVLPRLVRVFRGT
jgi:hypothetical protein